MFTQMKFPLRCVCCSSVALTVVTSWKLLVPVAVVGRGLVLQSCSDQQLQDTLSFYLDGTNFLFRNRKSISEGLSVDEVQAAAARSNRRSVTFRYKEEASVQQKVTR